MYLASACFTSCKPELTEALFLDACRFGYFHPDTGAWIRDQTQVLAFLRGRGFIDVSLLSPHLPPYLSFTDIPSFPSCNRQQVAISNAYALYPSTWTYAQSRALDLTRRSKFGYWTQAGLFIDFDLSLDVGILLNSCGYYQRKVSPRL